MTILKKVTHASYLVCITKLLECICYVVLPNSEDLG